MVVVGVRGTGNKFALIFTELNKQLFKLWKIKYQNSFVYCETYSVSRQSATQQLQNLGKNNKLVKFMYEDYVKTNSDRQICQPGSPRLV